MSGSLACSLLVGEGGDPSLEELDTYVKLDSTQPCATRLANA